MAREKGKGPRKAWTYRAARRAAAKSAVRMAREYRYDPLGPYVVHDIHDHKRANARRLRQIAAGRLSPVEAA